MVQSVLTVGHGMLGLGGEHSFAPRNRDIAEHFARAERSLLVPNPVVHFEIMGSDATTLQGFYRELFGWKVSVDNQWQYGMVETGGEGGINGGIAGTQNVDTNRVTIYAAVDDLQSYLDKAEGLGATTLMPITDMGDVVIAMFRDPAGNVTGLVKDSA
jgi:uncharacterized protein